MFDRTARYTEPLETALRRIYVEFSDGKSCYRCEVREVLVFWKTAPASLSGSSLWPVTESESKVRMIIWHHLFRSKRNMAAIGRLECCEKVEFDENVNQGPSSIEIYERNRMTSDISIH